MWSATTSFAFPEMHDIGTKLVQGMRGVCFDGTSHNNDTSLQPALIFPDSGLCYSTNNVFSGHGCVGSMNSFTVQGWVFLFFFFFFFFPPLLEISRNVLAFPYATFSLLLSSYPFFELVHPLTQVSRLPPPCPFPLSVSRRLESVSSDRARARVYVCVCVCVCVCVRECA